MSRQTDIQTDRNFVGIGKSMLYPVGLCSSLTQNDAFLNLELNLDLSPSATYISYDSDAAWGDHRALTHHAE